MPVPERTTEGNYSNLQAKMQLHELTEKVKGYGAGYGKPWRKRMNAEERRVTRGMPSVMTITMVMPVDRRATGGTRKAGRARLGLVGDTATC